MIIWGSKARKTTGQSGAFFCPSCKDDRRFTTYKWQKYFTLYFIPLFPMELLGSYVQCAGCRGEFTPTVLEHSREQILAALAPWKCGACSNVNAAEREQCISCGHSRAAASESEVAA